MSGQPWRWINPDSWGLPFGDKPGDIGDCPFSAEGRATGPGSGDCVGSSPSYYETLRAANVDGAGGLPSGDELLVRASDGLRVQGFVAQSDTNNLELADFPALGPPVAPSLAGDGSIPPGRWGSIRTADINGDGKAEVLAVDGTALRAWTYDQNTGWSQMPDNNPIKLAADPWNTNPEYYATIQTGDINGDGRADVVARGPSGIRTWFYNRRGTGGWERYLPTDFPALPIDALNTLTTTLKGNGAIVQTATSPRDVYTAENKPLDTPMGNLKTGLAQACGSAGTGWPTTYSNCTPPKNSSIDAGDWTAVINQVAAEADFVTEVDSYLGDLDSLQTKLFLQESTELPAIGDELGLAAAAGSTASFNMETLWSTIFGIAGSIVGLAGPEAGAGLAVASYLIAAIPQTSDTADDTFSTTYAGLKDQFAHMAGEMSDGLVVQSQQVRQDYGMLSLVAQLINRGTWAINDDGIRSAANQGFATWVYRSLTPAVYDRYVITNCRDGWLTGIYGEPEGLCQKMPAQVGVLGSVQNFTYIGSQMEDYKIPCYNQTETCWFANYVASPDVLSRIFGDVTTAKNGQCNYVPGKSTTVWAYGCPLGVDINAVLGNNTWGFTSYTGSPWVGSLPPRGASVSAAPGGRVALSGAGKGHALLYADVTVPRATRLDGATLRVGRLLQDERGGRGELTRRDGRTVPYRLRLRRVAAGRFVAKARGVRISLRRSGPRGRTRVTISAPALRVPRTCHALPAAIAQNPPPLHLRTELVLDDGALRLPIRIDHHLRCRRDKAGNVSGLEPVRFRVHPRRTGLGVTLRGPRTVTAGTTARFFARLRNRRSGGTRVVSSLWDLKLRSGEFQIARAGALHRIRELRRGRSRTVVIHVRVPAGAGGRFCTTVTATAPGTRAATARACAAVAQAARPRVTG